MKNTLCLLLFLPCTLLAQEISHHNIDKLTQDLYSPQWHEQYNAARELGNLHVEDQHTIEQLSQMLASQNQFVRYAAVIALGQIGTKAQSATTKLITALDSEKYEYLKIALIESIGKIGSQNPEVVLALAKVIQQEQNHDITLPSAKILIQICLNTQYTPQKIVAVLQDIANGEIHKKTMLDSTVYSFFILLQLAKNGPSLVESLYEAEAIMPKILTKNNHHARSLCYFRRSNLTKSGTRRKPKSRCKKAGSPGHRRNGVFN